MLKKIRPTTCDYLNEFNKYYYAMEQELLNGLHATFNSFKQNEHKPMYNN